MDSKFWPYVKQTLTKNLVAIKKKLQMKKFAWLLKLFKAILFRLVFFIHGFISVYSLYNATLNKIYWVLVLPLVLLLFESLVTMVWINRSGYRYFWPSGFLYITTIVPIIWVTELQLLDQRIAFCVKGPVKPTEKPIRGVLSDSLFHMPIRMIGKKVCELGMTIGLILGRWLIPSGHMTREQLSSLLLGYVGNAADTLDFIQLAEMKRVECIRSVTIAVLFVYTWSIYQFSLVTTATLDKDDANENYHNTNKVSKRKNKVAPNDRTSPAYDITKKETQKYADEVRSRSSTLDEKKKRGAGARPRNVMHPISPFILHSLQHQGDKEVKLRELHGEMYQILVTILMQDGPFLILRLYVLIYYGVDSETHIFFTCKNAVVVILLIYRLLILSCRGHDEEEVLHREEAAAKLRNTQKAIIDELLAETDRESILVV